MKFIVFLYIIISVRVLKIPKNILKIKIYREPLTFLLLYIKFIPNLHNICAFTISCWNYFLVLFWIIVRSQPIYYVYTNRNM